VEVTIFDPDLDPDGHLAQKLARVVVEGFVEPDGQQH
jgi:hypothetical protein